MDQNVVISEDFCQLIDIYMEEIDQVTVKLQGSREDLHKSSLTFLEERTEKEITLSSLYMIKENEYKATFLLSELKKKGTFYIKTENNNYHIQISNSLNDRIQGFQFKKVQKSTLLELTSKSNALKAITNKFIKNNTLEILPSYVYANEVINGMLQLHGYISEELISSNYFRLLATERGSDNDYFYTEIEQLENNEWTSYLELEKLTEGVWDLYIELDDGNSYRLKSWHSAIKMDHGLLNGSNDFINVGPYQTVKGSYSLEVLSQTITLQDINFHHSDINFGVEMQGKLVTNLQKDQIDSLIVKENGQEVHYEIPVKVLEMAADTLKITASIKYDEIDDENLNMNKWHCYIKTNQSDDLLRIKINKELEPKESIINFDDEPYKTYMYQTINGNLSIIKDRISLERDVSYGGFEGKSLLLIGYLNIPDFKNIENFTKQIIIRTRSGNNEIFRELNINRDGSFRQKINLKELLSDDLQRHNTIDFYIQLHNGHFTLERKLGKEDFDFKKDSVMTRKIIYDGDFKYYYLSITPYGNLKIDIFKVPVIKHLYLKYFQYFDRLLFKSKDIWLVGEREDTAQDTGYHFFKYCREQYPEKAVYYVIHPNSKDRKNLEGYENIVELGSLKHYRLSAIANKFIASHEVEYFLPTKAVDYPSYKQGKRVFLQHGILGRRKVEYYKEDYQYPYHLFCVSSEDEKSLVINEMGYSESEVKVTGLSRFDGLIDQSEQNCQILLIPTWRPWLTNDDNFLQSEFYQKYSSLLDNKSLHNLLNDYNVQLNVYLHYRLQPYIKYFNQLNHSKINIISLGTKNIQDLITEHNLMITDYSSVSMDFNYLNKPVIFYHFDYNKFFQNGILRHPNKTFIGDISSDEEEIIHYIRKYTYNNFEVSETQGQNLNYLFKYQDQNNSKRIFDEVEKL
ncbi:CDP-glycerol glycerophosphotransferase family protein [Alkalibacillus salilacus]|uniref:CDP-glycerol glycerophosphotransferase (TagB/SpsB family) n=1 Tax=Alkalibacillus salilacus TaxID=284582 RepID=A0ABT9VHU1_9BACI|nr:CDP-glycerol glycerophosphotransferase family protein [Alkalibacillus salilacus]MDQ0160528.1 CDP-glycerol glycerophosphotransferase (TagB/SpsB family) [Alkalibacillus salilacus]